MKATERGIEIKIFHACIIKCQLSLIPIPSNKQELLGLGIDIPGMASKGTLDREDDMPMSIISSSSTTRLRQTLSLRPEAEEDRIEEMSEGSELMNESVISSVTDRYNI